MFLKMMMMHNLLDFTSFNTPLMMKEREEEKSEAVACVHHHRLFLMPDFFLLLFPPSYQFLLTYNPLFTLSPHNRFEMIEYSLRSFQWKLSI